MEDLVGVGVADAAEDARVGEGSLEGAVFGGKRVAEGIEIGGEDVDASRINAVEGFFSAEDVKGGSAFGSGFGEDERAVGEVEGGEVVSASEFCAGGFPVEAAGDHEMEDEPVAVVEADGNALSDTAKFCDGVAFDTGDRRLRGAKEEGAGDSDLLEGLADKALFECADVCRDVR